MSERQMMRTVVLVATAIAVAQMGTTPAALAASGTAVISLNPVSGPAGISFPVLGGGCISASGVAHTARAFARGPGASTTIVSQAPAGPLPPIPPGLPQLPPGSFAVPLQIPPDAATGSTYRVSAQCTEPGQPPGPESASSIFTVSGPAVIEPVTTGATGGVGTNTGVLLPPTGTTTGRAAPIVRTPSFTG